MISFYPAIIEKARKGYGVFFPDFPGCVSFGKTLEEAALNAEEALSGHAGLMIDDGDSLPKATKMEKIPHDPDVSEAARILVRFMHPGRAIRVNISLEESLLHLVDSAAERRGLTRSGFFSEAARSFVSTH